MSMFKCVLHFKSGSRTPTCESTHNSRSQPMYFSPHPPIPCKQARPQHRELQLFSSGGVDFVFWIRHCGYYINYFWIICSLLQRRCYFLTMTLESRRIICELWHNYYYDNYNSCNYNYNSNNSTTLGALPLSGAQWVKACPDCHIIKVIYIIVSYGLHMQYFFCSWNKCWCYWR